jgi:predicted O-methyltransferase YrrM
MLARVINRVRVECYEIKLAFIKLKHRESIDFGNTKSFICDSFEHRYETYVKYVISTGVIDGSWLEFGVATGATTSKYVKIMPNEAKPLIGFDWFQGLPEKWAKHKKGTFSTAGTVPIVDGARMEIGLFEDTLPKFSAQEHKNISVLIIDCDTYSATKTIFNNLQHHIQVGTVIIFDEIHNGSGIYPEWYKHEYKAFLEFIEQNQLKFEWIAYVKNGEQASVRIIK